MFALSHTTGHAVLALSCISFNDGRRLFAKDIARCTGVPPAYLSKILNSLSEHGLLDAKRGYRGGFALTRPSTEIRLLDIVEAVEGEKWNSHCLLGMDECADERSCPTHAFWKVERRRIEEELSRISLAEVSEFEHRGGTIGTCVAISSTRPGSLPERRKPTNR